jgi:hypothetical protein
MLSDKAYSDETHRTSIGVDESRGLITSDDKCLSIGQTGQMGHGSAPIQHDWHDQTENGQPSA